MAARRCGIAAREWGPVGICAGILCAALVWIGITACDGLTDEELLTMQTPPSDDTGEGCGNGAEDMCPGQAPGDIDGIELATNGGGTTIDCDPEQVGDGFEFNCGEEDSFLEGENVVDVMAVTIEFDDGSVDRRRYAVVATEDGGDFVELGPRDEEVERLPLEFVPVSTDISADRKEAIVASADGVIARIDLVTFMILDVSSATIGGTPINGITDLFVFDGIEDKSGAGTDVDEEVWVVHDGGVAAADPHDVDNAEEVFDLEGIVDADSPGPFDMYVLTPTTLFEIDRRTRIPTIVVDGLAGARTFSFPSPGSAMSLTQLNDDGVTYGVYFVDPSTLDIVWQYSLGSLIPDDSGTESWVVGHDADGDISLHHPALESLLDLGDDFDPEFPPEIGSDIFIPHFPLEPPTDTDGDGTPDQFDTDDDDDGVDDEADNCALVANPDQEDTDGDGFGDLCEDDVEPVIVLPDGMVGMPYRQPLPENSSGGWATFGPRPPGLDTGEEGRYLIGTPTEDGTFTFILQDVSGFTQKCQITIHRATADLEATKTDSKDPVQVGEEFSYTLTIANMGPSTAHNVVVKDARPDGIDFLGAETLYGSCTLSAAGVVCNLEPIPAGESRTVLIAAVGRVPGPHANAMSAASAAVDENGASDVELTTIVEPAPASLNVALVAEPSVVQKGDSVAVRGTIHHAGGAPVTGLSFVLTVPAPIAFEVFPSGASCAMSEQTVTCVKDLLGEGETVGVLVTGNTGNATPGGTFESLLHVTGTSAGQELVVDQSTTVVVNQPPVPEFISGCDNEALSCFFDSAESMDPDGTIVSRMWDFGDPPTAGDVVRPIHIYEAPGTYTVTLTVTDNHGAVRSVQHDVTVGVSPRDLILTGSVENATAPPGVDPRFSFEIGNPNDVDATGMRLELSLNAIGAFFRETQSFPAGWNCRIELSLIACDVETFPAGGTVDFPVFVDTGNVGVPRVDVAAKLTVATPPTFATTLVSSTMNAPFLRTTKVHAINNAHEAGFELAEGLTVTYLITVENVGSAAATSFTILDFLPPEFVFVPTPPVNCTPGPVPHQLVCPFVNLAPGAAISFPIVVQPTSAGRFTNNAFETSVEPFQGASTGNPGGPDDPHVATTIINSPPITSLSATPGSLLVLRGQSGDATVLAHTSDGRTLNWTQFADWVSNDTAIADPENTFGTRGTVSGHEFGTATITITDPATHASTTMEVTVDEEPDAFFSAECAHLDCDVDGAGSADNGEIVLYEWDFGDGTTDISIRPTAQHTYEDPGAYTVTLTVTDDVGLTAAFSRTLAVTAPIPPVASFTKSCTDRACTFDASASKDPDGMIFTYLWDFGDGGLGSGISLEHTYEAAGTFTVRLTVEDDDGLTHTATMLVTVTAEPPSGGQPATLHMTRSGGPFPNPTIFSMRHDPNAGTLAMLPPQITFGGVQPGPMDGDTTIVAIAEQGDNTLSNTSSVKFFTRNGGSWMLNATVPLDGNFVRDLAFDPSRRFLWVSYSKAVFGGIEEHLVVIHVPTKTLGMPSNPGPMRTRLVVNPDPALPFVYALGGEILMVWAYDNAGALSTRATRPVPFHNDLALKNQTLYIGTNNGVETVIKLVNGLPGASQSVTLGNTGLFGQAPYRDPVSGNVCLYTVSGGGELRAFSVNDALPSIQLVSTQPPGMNEVFYFVVSHPGDRFVYVFGDNMSPPPPLPPVPLPFVVPFRINPQNCALTRLPPGFVPAQPGPPTDVLALPE